MDDFDLNKKKIDELEKKYLHEVVQPSFPFIESLGGYSYKYQPGDKPEVSFHLPKHFVSFKNKNKNEDKDREYYSEAKHFIHYTSLNNAVNILNDGFFRLNSLAYMDDPQELLYAGNEILGNYELSELKDLKERIFCISMCEYGQNNPDMFDSWRLYGEKGNGVGIVFKFSSDVEWWYGNYLSQIHYGNEFTNNKGIEATTKFFTLFKENHNRFIEENKSEIDVAGNIFGMKGKIPQWIAILLAFHKGSLYKIENEIRFLRFYGMGEKNFNSFTLNYKFEKTSYDKLLIKTRDNLKEIERDSKKINLKTPININDPASIEEVTKQSPIVEIGKIIIGYRHTKNFEKLKKAIQNGSIEKNGYGIDVELSPLSSAFA